MFIKMRWQEIVLRASEYLLSRCEWFLRKEEIRLKVTSLQVGWLTKSWKLWHIQTLINDFSILLIPFELWGLLTHSTCKIILNVFFHIVVSDQNVNGKSKTAFFHFLENPKCPMFDYFFCAWNIHHNFPRQTDTISISLLTYWAVSTKNRRSVF